MNQTNNDDVKSRSKTNPRKVSMSDINIPTNRATDVHRTTQRSKTLIRRTAKKPIPARQVSPPSPAKRRSMDIAKSSQISRFGDRNTEISSPVQKIAPKPDTPAQTHPLSDRVKKDTPTDNKSTNITSSEIKNAAISAAMNMPAKKAPKVSAKKPSTKTITITIIILLVAAVGAYFTYINMPNLSVKIAATQAGINAQYPDYHPDGYSIDGPVTFSDGEVTINFKANTGDTKFVLKQVKSSWDSSAVLENIVKKNSDNRYITSQERGLTIYTYNGDAAWVNGGILYTIEGDAPISNDQIRRIATSL